jgi:molybdate transport system ATP-binding protein
MMMADSTIQLAYALQRDDFCLDVKLDLPLRGITGIFGQSGAGKTTLLRCVAGLERPEAGRLVVAGELWQDGFDKVWRAVHERNIGYVFQEPRLFDHLDVRGNIDYGMRRSVNESGAGVDHVIQLLGLEQLLTRKPDALSGGEAQRVAIARALLRSPQFVLMDEPLASLDQARKDEIFPFLERLHAESDIPIIYVSHNLDEICRLCDHLVVIDDGRVVADGDLQTVLVRTDLPALTGTDAGSVIQGIVESFDEQDELSLVRFSGGSLWVPGRPGPMGATVRARIRANDISLCRSRPEQSTILNILPATVDDIQGDVGPSALVKLVMGRDSIVARVTRRSARELAIKKGDELFVQIKSVVVRPQSDKPREEK